jgi:hypothetical protein
VNCDAARDRLTAYVDGELDDAALSALRGHLRTCDACRALARDEVDVRDAVSRLPAPDVPPTLWDGIQARLATHEVADSKRSRWWLWWQAARPRLVVPVVLAGVAVIAVIAWQRRGDDSDAPKPTRPAPAPEVATITPPTPPPPTPPPPAAECGVIPDRDDVDVSEVVAAMPAAIDRRYQCAVDELLAIVAEDRPTWSARRARAFDVELHSLRAAVDSAAPGRPRERAWQAIIDYLHDAVAVQVVAEAEVTP